RNPRSPATWPETRARRNSGLLPCRRRCAAGRIAAPACPNSSGWCESAYSQKASSLWDNRAVGISQYLKEIGRGKQGARPLAREQAADLFGQVLDGSVSDLEIGAFCIAMRV